jgi:hypothetical protein
MIILHLALLEFLKICLFSGWVSQQSVKRRLQKVLVGRSTNETATSYVRKNGK